MTNTKHAVDWALGQGANAVEVDLAVTSGGDLKNFFHSEPGEACDCSCLCPAPIWSRCRMFPTHVCSILIEDVSSGSPCNADESVAGLLQHLASKTELALVVLDSKIHANEMSITSMQSAGRKIIQALNAHLFGANFKGNVIIGSPQLDTLPYLEAAVGEARTSQYRRRIFYTVDLEKNNVVNTLQSLHTMATSNIVYGIGISACAPASVIRDSTLQIAALNKASGVSGLTYIWTLNKKSSMKRYLPYVQGIMTNYPADLDGVLRAAGIKLATPSSIISPTTTSSVVTSTSGFDCDCDYHPGGCTISQAAPSGFACKCRYKGFWTCGGNVVQRRDTSSNYCKNPDTSAHSCLLGDGDY